MYDAIIVGARCAGSPTAMLLARSGYRVLLVDRATFPSDTISTHFIRNAGTARLKRWGLLDKAVASNPPPISKWVEDLGDFSLTGSPPLGDGVPPSYGPRRTVLDQILVEAAVDAGAELREGFSVSEILTDGDTVTGIRGRSKGGSIVKEETRILLGADGKNSFVAGRVGAAEYHSKPSLACYYYTYWSGFPSESIEMHWRHQRVVLVMPTNDDLSVIVVGWPHSEFHAFRSDIEANYLKTIEAFPELCQRLVEGNREERFFGMADLPNFFRKPYGRGWALVGDAGYHRDPITAHGISDAFRDAELLSEAIDAGFSGRRPLEEALADYERQRNEEALPWYETTCQTATLVNLDSSKLLRLRAALRENQTETDRYLGTLAGTLPFKDFYSPSNIRRILSSAKKL